MKPHASVIPRTRCFQGGFTMIEIAIALGVIAFALVAIMGILPLGLTVQRDNRFETIINQDATYWLGAIRDGARETSLAPEEDLTNYIERIKIGTVTYDVKGAPPLDSTSNIVGILTQPGLNTNEQVFAYVRAISGSSGEKRSEVSFQYRMEVQIQQADPALPTLWELRLVMAWPVVTADGEPAGARKPLIYRTMVSRNPEKRDKTGSVAHDYYYFTP